MQILLFLFVGFVIGTAGGMLGIGGGVLLVPVLTEILGYDHRQAAGITLAVAAIPVALPGAWQYYQLDILKKPELVTALCIAIGFALGIYTGGGLAPKIPVEKLRLYFGLILVYVAMRMIVRSRYEVAVTAAGISVAVVAWLTYLGLLVLGRRHVKRPPSLHQQIHDLQQQDKHNIDYYI